MLLTYSRTSMMVAVLTLLSPILARAADDATTKPSTTAAAPSGVFEDEKMPETKKEGVPKHDGALKVGVIVSKFTATGPSWSGSPYGYLHAAIAKDLQVEGIELSAIIEPDTDGDADQEEAIKESFPEGVAKIDGTDADALKALDVIVGQRISNMKDEMISAVHKAVENGTGLFIAQTFGTVTPGYSNEIADLFGMDGPAYAFNATPIACEVQATDAILEGTADAGTDWQAQPSGTAGHLRDGGTSLVKVADISTVGVRRSNDAAQELPMLYFTHFGKGGIVVSNFKDLPDPLANLQGEKFFVRCVKRAAALRTE